MFTATLLGVGDPMMWFSGVENLLYAAVDEPEFLKKYIQIVSDWNMKILEIYLDAKVDLVTRRGFYESTDSWTPKTYKEFLFEPLKKEIQVAHQAGAKVTYLMMSGAMPLVDIFLDLEFDILSSFEPKNDDASCIKKIIGDKIVLSTGVNNYHVLEAGTESEVQKAVIDAIETFSPNGGFILAPIDSILDTSETARRNFYKMIETWKEFATV